MSIAMQLRRAPQLECLEARHALDAALPSGLPALLPQPAPAVLQAADAIDLPPPALPAVPPSAVGLDPTPSSLSNAPAPVPAATLEGSDVGTSGGMSSKSSWDGQDPPKETPTVKAPEKSSAKGIEALSAPVGGKLTRVWLAGPHPASPAETVPFEAGGSPLPGRAARSTPPPPSGPWGIGYAPGQPQGPVSETQGRGYGPAGERALESTLTGRAPLGPTNLLGLATAFFDRAGVYFGAAVNVPATSAPSSAGWLPGSLAEALSWEVLDQFFSRAEGLPPEARPGLPGRPTSRSQPEPDGADAFLPPLYLGAYVPALGKPVDPVAAGYQYLCNYARQSIRAAERQVGPLNDHDDIVQQICLEWLERAGSPEQAFPRLWEKAPAEMQLLRQTVHRVIARVAYQQRRGPGQVELSSWPAPDRRAEQLWLDFQSDCERGVGRLTRPEWHILDLRRQGYTFAEIGAAVAMPRQRVWEVYHHVVARLQSIYGSAGGGDERP